MSAGSQKTIPPGKRPGVTVQMPEAQPPSSRAPIPGHARSVRPPTAARPTRLAPFVIVLLVLALSYVLFTAGTMVPQARSHFLHLLINPAPGHFLKAD